MQGTFATENADETNHIRCKGGNRLRTALIHRFRADSLKRALANKSLA